MTSNNDPLSAINNSGQSWRAQIMELAAKAKQAAAMNKAPAAAI